MHLFTHSEVYSETEVHGCMFHFCQCMGRHVQQCGLQKAYSEDFAAATRSLAALAFILTDNVVQEYELLLKSLRFVDNDYKLNGILSYFAENLIGVLQRNDGKKPMYYVEL